MTRLACSFGLTGALLLLCGPTAGQSIAQPTDGVRLAHVGCVTHPPVDEMSGLTKRPPFENVWWIHNDSGDDPRFFAIDSTSAVHLAPWRRGTYAAGAALDTTDRPTCRRRPAAVHRAPPHRPAGRVLSAIRSGDVADS